MGDTTNDPVIARRKPKPYRNYQMSEDYYQGGQMLWLEADVRLRQLSGGKRSLDDFARAFFGQDDGVWERPATYTFDDVVATLEKVQPTGDWESFLRDRVDGRVGLTGGIEASGWRLVYRDKPSAYQKAVGKGRGANFIYSLGLSVDGSGKVGEVRWDSPASTPASAPACSSSRSTACSTAPPSWRTPCARPRTAPSRSSCWSRNWTPTDAADRLL
jgi:Predicted protease with the C-terminal PDZ domain